MGMNPEHAILRRFSALGVQNLLYYQAELTYLEERLRKIEAWSLAQGDGAKQYQFARDWDTLKRSWKFHSSTEKDGGMEQLNLCYCSGSLKFSNVEDIPKGIDDEQLRLVLRLRSTLKQYSESARLTLTQASQLSSKLTPKLFRQSCTTTILPINSATARSPGSCSLETMACRPKRRRLLSRWHRFRSLGIVTRSLCPPRTRYRQTLRVGGSWHTALLPQTYWLDV